jgi:tetratricopeptide (TPR) repeat protein
LVLAILFIVTRPVRADLSPLVVRGDELYKERGDLAKGREAVKLYENAFAETPQEEAAVRASKAYYWLVLHAPEESQLETAQKGIDWAKKAIELNPKSVGGHFWLGVHYGKFGEAKGVLKSLSLVGPIKDAMQQVIDLNPAYEGGGAFRVLGRLYFRLPRLVGGSFEKSVSFLRRSIEYGPRRLLTHVFLAETYMKQEQYKQAQQELNFVLKSPLEPGYEPESQEDKKEAKKLQEELNKKLKE